MPAVLEPASTTLSWEGYGGGCSRWRPTECRSTCRCGSPLVLSRVHWVRPERVAEVKFLTWTEDNLPRHSSMKGCAKTSRRKRCGVR
jgi:ATP-dependent DNA ligase